MIYIVLTISIIGAGLSAMIQHEEPLLVIGCTIKNGLLWEPLLIRLFIVVLNQNHFLC
jgi:hypothetical protein